MDVFDLIKRHEGYRRHPYLCPAGKLTIGYGRNLDDSGVSRDEAAFLLRNDIEDARAMLRTEPYWLDLGEVRQAVLINMCINMGWPRLSGFDRMRKALGRKDFSAAAFEMLDSVWHRNRQVGNRSQQLADMMETGTWPS